MKSIRKHHNPIIGSSLEFIELAEDNNGAHTVFEITLAAGGGNGLHYHTDYEETFTAIGGVLGIVAGEKTLHLQPKEYITAAIGMNHKYFNDSDQEIKFRVEFSPASIGFEDMLMVSYGLARTGKSSADNKPNDTEIAAAILQESNTLLPNIPKEQINGMKAQADSAINSGKFADVVKEFRFSNK